MNLTTEALVRRIASAEPVVYMIFDLLWLDGHSLLGESYENRRKLLGMLELGGSAWQVPAYHVGNGAGLLEASRAQGLEGVVAKRLDSTYLPGRRSAGWLKVKNFRSAEVVVGGWKPGESGRTGRLGSLAMGVYVDGELRYVGNAGSGFNEAELKRVEGLLEPLARKSSPFVGPQPERGTRFVEPKLVASVRYGDITRDGTLRHPVYKGMRDDIAPEDVGMPDDG
jgi:bifunctional non-homologous end joining protein LigD